MSTPPEQHAQVEIEIEDPPDTGERHTFTAATEEEATAAAEDYFGVNEAQERDND